MFEKLNKTKTKAFFGAIIGTLVGIAAVAFLPITSLIPVVAAGAGAYVGIKTAPAPATNKVKFFRGLIGAAAGFVAGLITAIALPINLGIVAAAALSGATINVFKEKATQKVLEKLETVAPPIRTARKGLKKLIREVTGRETETKKPNHTVPQKRNKSNSQER